MNYGVFSGLFWGVILITAGVLLVIKNLLHLNIPVFKILVGIFFVYLGVSMLAGGFSKKTGSEIIFSSGTTTADTTEKNYNVIFGSGVLDFSRLSPSDTVRVYEVNVIFSSAELRMNPAIPYEVKATAVFGSAETPDDKTVSFGSRYSSAAGDSASAKIIIEANTVFGSMDIVDFAAEKKEAAVDSASSDSTATE